MASLVIVAVFTKGVLWSKVYPTFEPGPQLTVLVSDANKHTIRPDGIEVVGTLVVPCYMYWLTHRVTRHDVRINYSSKQWEWEDAGNWKKMPEHGNYPIN